MDKVSLFFSGGFRQAVARNDPKVERGANNPKQTEFVLGGRATGGRTD